MQQDMWKTRGQLLFPVQLISQMLSVIAGNKTQLDIHFWFLIQAHSVTAFQVDFTSTPEIYRIKQKLHQCPVFGCWSILMTICAISIKKLTSQPIIGQWC